MNKRVMLVESDRSIRDSLKKVLEQAGFQPITAEAGTALAQLESEPAELLILDLDGARGPGWDFFGEVTAQWPWMPIVIITSLDDAIDASANPRITATLEKPIEVPLLLELLQAALAESAANRLRRFERLRLGSAWPMHGLSAPLG